MSERGSSPPTATDRNVVPGPDTSSTRSSHPVVAEPDVPRSRQSCAWKWLRERSGVETAGTAATLPALMSGSSGDIAGCSAQLSPNLIRVLLVMAMSGRLLARIPASAALVGMSSESPSMPPRRKMTTSVPLVGVPGSAYATRVVTSWVASAATPTPRPPLRNVRRLKPRDHASSRCCAAMSLASAAARMAEMLAVGPSVIQSGQSGCSELMTASSLRSRLGASGLAMSSPDFSGVAMISGAGNRPSRG